MKPHLHSGKDAELAFDGYVVLVGVFDDLLRQGDVLFVGKVGTVDHDGGESVVDAVFAGFKAVAVIQVQDDRDVITEFSGILAGAAGHVAQQVDVRIVTSAFGNLQNDGALCRYACLDDRLQLLQVVEVIRGNGVSAFDRLGEHFLGIH